MNYPNNPTGAVADKNFLERVVEFAQENSLIVCYDNAYSEITFDGYRAPSIFEVEGAKEVAIEFHSCSKTFNMTGDRIGFAVGNPQLVKGLTKVKSQVDSGPPIYIQKAAIKALGCYTGNKPPEHLEEMNRIYTDRRNLLVECLNSLGLKCDKPKATFYVWLNCGCDCMEFTAKLLETGVIVTPGIGFGKQGKTRVRFSFTQPMQKIKEACERMEVAL